MAGEEWKKNRVKEDQIYDIMTGYYPEIAAKISYKNDKGKGQTGLKYKRKRGFTDASIARARTEEIAKGANKAIRDKRFKNRNQEVAGLTGTAEDIYLTKTGREKTLEDVELYRQATSGYWKFVGGTEQYKLYGDQVWYMHGTRPRDAKKMFTDYVNNVFGDKTPRFSNIYSRAEDRLIKEATSLAEEIFNIAEDIVVKSFEKAEGGERAAEEIGFTEGEFEYVSHAEALARYKGTDKGKALEAQLKSDSKLSSANETDMVLLKDGVLESIIDVTEMPLTQKGQHGVTRVPPELVELIAEAKAGPEGKIGESDLPKLKQAVKSMFTNAIDKDYNPVIRKLKKEAGIGGKSGGGDMGDKKWDDVLRKIGEAAGKGPKDKVGTREMGELLGQKMRQVGFNKMSTKAAKQVAIEYIAHILGSMNAQSQGKFLQAHKVFEYSPSKMGVYAEIAMKVVPETLLFRTPLQDKHVNMYTGFNYTTAKAASVHQSIHDGGREHSRMQKRIYAGTKVTGTAVNGINAASTTAVMGLSRSARPTTTVAIPGNEEIEKALLSAVKDGLPDLAEKLAEGDVAGGKLKNRMYGMGTRTGGGSTMNNERQTRGATGMRRQKPTGQAMFWALPYVGVLQSEFIEDKSTE
tara:strand:+ start:298 stop:2199 length:1902 start_codon:yes stop_codon:yes gene_type:complete